MTKRKSIVSSFGDFTGASKPSAESAPKKADEAHSGSPPKTRVSAGIIGATKRSLTELREERDTLLASVKDGDVVVTLDTTLIDPSPFRDRLPDDNEENFEAFKKTLHDEGQKIPITVRRHPQDTARYQTVYGHRRTQALRDLGMPVEAILREYSDRDLVVAQGIENANRQDLSWIEKALFAATMESQGIKPRDIKAALSVDDAQVSKFRAVSNALGRDVIELIGRAPKVGRPRWLELIALVNSKSDQEKIRKTLSADKVLNLSSDERFMKVLGIVSVPTANKISKNRGGRQMGKIGQVMFGPHDIKLVVEKKYSSEFNAFFEAEVDAIVAKFMRKIGDDK